MPIETVFAGVSNVFVTDGETSLLVDGFFSRPSTLRLLATRLRPDRRRIEDALSELPMSSLDAVLVSHSHVDHALDSPVVADLTGALLAGSSSTRRIAEGYGMGDVPFRELVPGEPFGVGRFTVAPIHALHSDPDRAPGDITAPVVPPARSKAYCTGGCFSFHIAHPEGTVFVHPSANFVAGALAGLTADTVYLGVGGAGAKDAAWVDAYWAETVGVLGPRTVRPVHWDAFWRPLDKPLKPLPNRFDRLDTTMDALHRLAPAGMDLQLPELWRRETVVPARP